MKSGVKVKVNGKTEYLIDVQNKTINEKPFDWDVVEINNNRFHILKDNKSYNVEVVEANHTEKSFVIQVNNNKYRVEAKDRYDELLHDLGMDNANQTKVNEIKAPMPGLVLEVLVKEGQQIKKGDTVIVLEAMKMENVLKSPADGIIKKVNVAKGDKVEKNTVLINF